MVARESALPGDKRLESWSWSPECLHFDIARKFLEAGFHVVLDKPMTYSLQEAEELARIVKKSGLVFGLTHNYTGNPVVRHARDMFRSGGMGRCARSCLSTCRTS